MTLKETVVGALAKLRTKTESPRARRYMKRGARGVAFAVAVLATEEIMAGCGVEGVGQQPGASATPTPTLDTKPSPGPVPEDLANPNSIPVSPEKTLSSYSPFELASIWDSSGKGLDTTHKALYDQIQKSFESSSASLLDPTHLKPVKVGTIVDSSPYRVNKNEPLSDFHSVVGGYFGVQTIKVNGNPESYMVWGITKDGKNETFLMPFDQLSYTDASGKTLHQGVSLQYHEGDKTGEQSGGSVGEANMDQLKNALSPFVGQALVLVFERPTDSTLSQTWTDNNAKVDGLIKYLTTKNSTQPDFVYSQIPTNLSSLVVGPWLRQMYTPKPNS